MMKKPKVRDFHAVPRGEESSHNCFDGHECACEPRCALAAKDFRLFIHAGVKLLEAKDAPPSPSFESSDVPHPTA